MSDFSKKLSAAKAAEHLNLSTSTLSKLRHYGTGPVYIKLNRRVAYDLVDLEAWVAAHRRRSTSDPGEAA